MNSVWFGDKTISVDVITDGTLRSEQTDNANY